MDAPMQCPVSSRPRHIRAHAQHRCLVPWLLGFLYQGLGCSCVDVERERGCGDAGMRKVQITHTHTRTRACARTQKHERMYTHTHTHTCERCRCITRIHPKDADALDVTKCCINKHIYLYLKVFVQDASKTFRKKCGNIVTAGRTMCSIVEYTHTDTCMHTHTHTHIHTHTHTHTSTHVRTHAHLHILTHSLTHARTAPMCVHLWKSLLCVNVHMGSEQIFLGEQKKKVGTRQIHVVFNELRVDLFEIFPEAHLRQLLRHIKTLYVCMYVCTCVCVCVCVCVCMYVCMYACMYIHTYNTYMLRPN